MEAVKQNGYALQDVKEQTPEICMAAVRQNSNVLEYVEPQFRDAVSRNVNQWDAANEEKTDKSATAVQNEKRRLFVDLDGTCALWQPVAEEELYEQGYYRNLPPYENVVKAVNELAQENSDIEVYVLSKYLTGSKYALKEKQEWVKEHLPNIPAENQIYVPYSKDKKDLIPGGLRETDYLLDDFTDNFNGWQPPAKAVKLLNGINNTKGKWQENKISAFRRPEVLKKGLCDIVINGEVVKDLPPQLDNTFDYEAFYDERQGYKYSNFADNHKELLKATEKKFNNRKTIVINAFGGAGAGKTVACMDICQQLKKAGYNAEYVSEYCKDLVYEDSDMLDGTAKNQFKILQEQMRRVDRLIGQVDFIVTDSPVLLNEVYNKELTSEYKEMVEDIFDQYQNFNFIIQRDNAYYQTEGRIHTLEESMEKDNQIKEMLQTGDFPFETYNHETIHQIVENVIHVFHNISEEDKKGEERVDNQLEQIMKKLDAFAETADDYEMFADKEFQERLYQTLQECKKMLQDNPDGIITLLPKFYEQSNPNELDVKPDLWNEFWNYLERYGVTGDERFSNRLNNIAAQPETKEQAFTIMNDIKEYLDNRLYMTSYMRGDVAVNEDIASYYLENAYRYLNEGFDNPDRNQEMENQIKAVQKVFSLDKAASGRFYTTNLGGTGWGMGENPYFYITEDFQSSFEAAYASYMASDENGRVIGYSKVGMSTSHLVELAGCHYDKKGNEVHTLNYHLENQVFDEDSKVLADIEKRLYEELKQRNAKNMAVQTEDFNSKVSNPAPVALQLERIQVAIESTADYVDPGIGFTAVAAGDMPAGTKYRIVTYGENGRLIPYQENSAIYSDRTEVEAYLEEHKDRLENIDYDEMVYQAGKKIADYDLKQRQRIEEGLHSLQFDEDGYLHFSITVNDYDYDGLYRVYAPADGKNRELVSINNGQGEPFFQENWELIRQHLEQYVNAHPEIGPDGEEIPREKASVYCEWSEHDAFEEGKVYSVFEFDRLMEQADAEWIKLRQQEREQYGEDAFEELYERNLPQHQTYAKTKYTVFVPGMPELTLHQDIGDGLGGMIEFVRTTTHKHYAVPLENAFFDGLQQELDNRTMIEEQAVKLQSEMKYEEANALLKILEESREIDTTPENLIKLQGVYGHHKGTPAKELKIGDVLVWNYGETSEVVGMEPSKTGKTIVFQMKSTNDGEVRDRRMNVETLVVVQDKNSGADNNLLQEKADSGNAKAEEKAEAADSSNKNPVNDTEQYKQLIESHKRLISSRETSRIPLVINAFGGPGSGKSTSCMDICQQLKKQNYKAEYVSEYAKDLVYDKNEKLLDGSPESQFEILKEQLKRVDRLYKSGEVDFIVTDSPILLNEIYNKSLTEEYDSMVASLHNDFNNFNYFMERDASAYQEEGRIQNLEESQKIDQDIKQLLGDKKVRYETYNHDTVEKIVPDIVHAFNRLNGIEEDATEKQKAYAEKIAQTLNITLPGKTTKAAYKTFINENHEAFLNSNAPLKEKGAGTGSYQDYLEMVTKDGNRLGDVPKEHYTDELLLAAVRSWGSSVRQIPEDRITTEIAMASVQQYGQNLKHVPEKLKSEEICVAAYISSSGKSVCYTPRDMKDRVKEEGQKRLSENNSATVNAKRQIESDQIQQKGQEWASRIGNLLKEHETDPDAMVEDIAFAAKFYRYSARNIQLMRQQNPGITYVAKASLFNEMGYHIKDGEQAMVGRVPESYKFIVNEKGERIYPEKYTPEIKQKLKEGTLKEEQAIKRFKYVAAFYDISQTDCPAEDYPSVFHMGIPSELHQDAFDAMKKFAEENLGFKVMVTDLKSISLRGSCEPDNKIIRINDRLEATMALSTLCHEIAHGIIHTSGNSTKMSAAQKECEADVMDIMLEASLGLAINESRRDHLFENFQAYKKEQAAKEQPYEVTLEKIIDRVQSKVFRKYIDDINICLDKYLPAEGSRNEEAAEEVVRNLAMLDYAYDMNHEVLIDGKNPLFDSRRMEDYRDLYRKEKDSFRLHGSFMPKLAVFRLTNDGEGYLPDGGDLWDLCEVGLLLDDTVDKILNHSEQIKPEEQPHVPVGSIVILKENVLSEPRIYLVTRDEGFREITEDMKGMYEQVKNRIDCDFYVRTEYLCIHNLLENGMELEPQLVKKYDHICRAFGYPKNTASDSSIQLMARINLITENLPQSSKDMIAEYVFRTGNFEKAERYAARIGREQDAVRQMRQEMRLVDSYKYMLWTIEEYEKNNDISEKNRLTTGAYNTSAIPVLSENVSSLSQINQKFLLIRKYASPDSVKYYSIVKDTSSEERYRIAYVELNEYEPEVVYSAVTFKNYEEAEKFYDQYLHTENSRLADSSQAERLAELENRGNQIALSEITSIGKTISAGKQSYMEAGLDEEAALEMLRMEIRDEYPRIKSADTEEVQQELETLKNFKKIVNSYGRERFIELSNLENLKETDVSLRLQKQLAEQADILDKMNITGIDDVKQCVTAALDSSVTASDLEKAFNAIDSAVLSAEFSNLETEFEGFEEYNYVLDTLKAAQVTPDKFCYVDFGAEPGPYLYTSDIAGNIYRKSLSSEWDGSIGELNTRLKEAGYEICSSLNDFRAYAANNRLGIFNVPEKEKNEAFIRILESTNDRLPKGQVLSVYDFKDTIDKLTAAGEFKTGITYSLVTRKDQEINSYIDTYSGNSEKNVYEQLYEKAQEKVPELSRVISRQYYQDQINSNERYLVRPLLQQLKRENKSVEDSEELGSVMDSNARLEKIIKELDLSPADAELLKLNAGNIRTEQSVDIQAQQQMNQKTQQKKLRSQQQEGISM